MRFRKFWILLAAALGAGHQAYGQACTPLSIQNGCPIYAQGVLQIPQILPNGTNILPSLAFANAPSTGIYWDSAGTLGLAFTFAGTPGGTWSPYGINGAPIGATTPAAGKFTLLTATQQFFEPTWTTSTRPASPVVGEQGWNTSLGLPEWWTGSAWANPQLSGGILTEHGISLLTWSNNVTVAAGTYITTLSWPWNSGTINSVTYATGGSATPSFTGTVAIGGTSITGCTTVSVASSTKATTACTGANAVTAGQEITVVIASVNGTPNEAAFQINYTHSEP
jgi:hypothetical protein